MRHWLELRELGIELFERESFESAREAWACGFTKRVRGGRGAEHRAGWRHTTDESST